MIVRRILEWCRDLPPHAKLRMAVAFGAGYLAGLATVIVLVVEHWN